MSLIWGIFLPFLLGFAFRLPEKLVASSNRLLNWLVYAILVLMGMSLAQTPNLAHAFTTIFYQAGIVFACVMGSHVVLLMALDVWRPLAHESHEAPPSWRMLGGSFRQMAALAIGVAAGEWVMSVDHLSFYISVLLGGLLWVVGMQLRSANVSLWRIIMDKRAMVLTAWAWAAVSLGGCLAAWCLHLPLRQGLALASGLGWYSLSGIVMTQAYGAAWGSVALLNDLGRELFALVAIGPLMRRFPATAVSVGGATTMDFTLPAIRQAGGIQMVSLAMGYGFMVNLLVPPIMNLWAFG